MVEVPLGTVVNIVARYIRICRSVRTYTDMFFRFRKFEQSGCLTQVTIHRLSFDTEGTEEETEDECGNILRVRH